MTLITAGSQAEPVSALVRIAMDEHKQVALTPGDAVVLSSRIIPGNERADLEHREPPVSARRARVHYGRSTPIHVSGHASQEELKLVLNLVRPRYFVPVHGEYRHLVRHLRLAREVGVPADGCHLLEDGDVLEIDADGARRAPSACRRGACSSTARASATSATWSCATAAISREDGLVLAVLAIAAAVGRDRRRAGPGRRAAWSPRT